MMLQQLCPPLAWFLTPLNHSKTAFRGFTNSRLQNLHAYKMSGRSGFVREKRRKGVSLTPGQPSTTSTPATSPTGYAHPYPAVIDGPSEIERSAIRVAVEAQSGAIRDGIGNLFAFGKKSDRHSTQYTDTEPRTSNTSFDFPRSSGVNSNATLASGAYSNAKSTSGADLNAKSDPDLRLWSGAGQQEECDPADCFTAKHLWFEGKDTLIFLSAENEHGDLVGAPSFICDSKSLRSMKSIVWNTLLAESAKDRAEVIEVANSLLQNREQLPAAFKDAMLRQETSLFAGVEYIISFAPPKGLESDQTWRHSIRNALAVLHDAPLLGKSYYEIFMGLYERLSEWSNSEAAKLLVIKYIERNEFHDVRLDASAALGLLVVSERLRWDDGYREGFVHCVGMHFEVKKLGESALSQLEPISKYLLDHHALEMQNRILKCAERLATFNVMDMWTYRIGDCIEAKDSFDAVKDFFNMYYKTTKGAWPPNVTDGSLWLRPNLVFELQRDLGALYDILVDRSVRFRYSEAGWSIERNSREFFNPDSDSIPMTRLLGDFDEEYGYVHIPHPFPILPKSIVPINNGHSFGKPEDIKKSKGLMSRMLKKDKKQDSTPSTEKTIQQSLITEFQLAYSDATNCSILGGHYTGNLLAEEFLKHEQTTELCKVNPRIARRGRWLFVYAILQTLASVSESVPGLAFPTNGLDYFTCTSLKDLPHWKLKKDHFVSAQMTTSHCWKVPVTWQLETVDRPREKSFMPQYSSPNSPNSVNTLQFPSPPQSSTYENENRGSGTNYGYQTPQMRPPAYYSGGAHAAGQPQVASNAEMRWAYQNRPLPSPVRAAHPPPHVLAESITPRLGSVNLDYQPNEVHHVAPLVLTYAGQREQRRQLQPQLQPQFQANMSQAHDGNAVYEDDDELYNDPGPFKRPREVVHSTASASRRVEDHVEQGRRETEFNDWDANVPQPKYGY
jgi:hypothetical protein